MAPPSNDPVRDTRLPHPWDLPGLETSSGLGHDAWLGRTSANSWSLVVGPLNATDATAVRAAIDRAGPHMPSAALGSARAEGATGAVTCARIEHDLCGAWVTVANAGARRPVVVRRAGWVDLRGFTQPELGSSDWVALDDRVGLGPGDAIVVVAGLGHEGDAGSDAWPWPELPSDLLHASGLPVDDIALAAARHGADPDATMVVKVPDDLGDDPHGRVSAAIGVPVGELDLPGYPLGDLQPDLWTRPPLPPREARLLLERQPSRLGDLRSMLRRLIASWRLEDAIEVLDVELLATELAANALEHGGTAAHEPEDIAGVVIVRYDGAAIRVEVGDTSEEAPAMQPRQPDRDSGRGLQIVDAIATRWGVTPTSGHGKRVWFEIAV